MIKNPRKKILGFFIRFFLRGYLILLFGYKIYPDKFSIPSPIGRGAGVRETRRLFPTEHFYIIIIKKLETQ
jgi:hypothetical protein